MLHDSLVKLQSIFVSDDVVSAYRPMVPKTVAIQWKIEDDTYIAYLESADDEKIKGLLITEGRSETELNDNLNQLIYMNAKIPEKVRPRYGNVFEFRIGDSTAKAGELVLART